MTAGPQDAARPAAADEGVGRPPAGDALPAALRLGAVRLQVADLERSVLFYQDVLGMRPGERRGTVVTLAAADGTPLVELQERPGARPAAARGQLGLFHVAYLLPDRPALGRFVRHLAALGIPAGAGDHLVSEALYLTDPDGLGVEVYADRPRETWRRAGRELVMTTDAVDMQGLAAAADAPWSGMPAGTRVGHVHLHVGDLAAAGAFYGDALGFHRTVWSYPGALFLAAGGYHHHLGANTWAGPRARPAAEDAAHLVWWTVELPDEPAVAAAADRLAAAGHAGRVEEHDDGAAHVVRDPWGIAVRLRVAPPAVA